MRGSDEGMKAIGHINVEKVSREKNQKHSRFLLNIYNSSFKLSLNLEENPISQLLLLLRRLQSSSLNSLFKTEHKNTKHKLVATF